MHAGPGQFLHCLWWWPHRSELGNDFMNINMTVVRAPPGWLFIIIHLIHCDTDLTARLKRDLSIIMPGVKTMTKMSTFCFCVYKIHFLGRDHWQRLSSGEIIVSVWKYNVWCTDPCVLHLVFLIPAIYSQYICAGNVARPQFCAVWMPDSDARVVIADVIMSR